VFGAEKLGGGRVLHDDDEALVAGPGEHAGNGAGGPATGLAEPLSGGRGDQPRGPGHRVDEAAQGGGPARGRVGAPVLGVDEVCHDAQSLGLVSEDSPSRLDEMPPPRVRLVSAIGEAGGGTPTAVSQRPRDTTVRCSANGPGQRRWSWHLAPGAAP